MLLADEAEAVAGRVVAERSGNSRVVRRARRDTERGGGGVVAREVGVEQRGVVGRDGAAHSGGDELRQWVLLERTHDAGAEIGERAYVEDGAARRQLSDELRILDGADPVADAVGVQLLDRGAHRIGTVDLAGVR